jgi:anion transporter
VIDLSAVRLLAGFSPVELARLLPKLEEQSVPAGAVLFQRGEVGDCLYIVRGGLAEARASDEASGADYPLAVFQPGDSFGEMALLTDEPRSATVVALTDLQLWALPKDRFLELVEQTPRLALTIGRLLSERLQATNQAVSSMHTAFDAAAELAYEALDPQTQRFLHRTSPLDPVQPAVVDRALESADSERVLADLAGRLPFVRPVDGGYRYHRLFRDVLTARLLAELGEREHLVWLRHLAACAKDEGQYAQAVWLLAAGEDVDEAESLAVEQGRALLQGGRLDELESLYEALPPPLDSSSGELAELRAELLTAGGRPEEAIEVLEDALRRGDSASSVATDEQAARLVRRYRRLAELNFGLGRTREAVRWLRQAGEAELGDSQATEGLESLAYLPSGAQMAESGPRGLLSLASVSGLRRASGTAGALGGKGVSRPLGFALATVTLLWFFRTEPPTGLSAEGYRALGVLAAAMPLLVFAALDDYLVTLLMAAAWAGLGLVAPRVALSGFATPGWFLVLAVLAVGVALARSGLLYRGVLALLVHVPPNHVVLTLTLAAAGLIFSPAMPNATARTALAAPLALEVSDALGYSRRGRGSAAIGLAVLLGFGQMCALFLTASSSGLLVHSLLPAESRARFGWVNWFLAALPLHVVIFALTYLAVLLLLRPEKKAGHSSERVEAQRQILGRLSRAERLCAAVFVLLLTAFILGPLAGVDPVWPAILAMVLLGATGALDQQGFRNGINWGFLLFFGVMLSMAEVFATLNVDAWLAAAAAAPLAPLASSPALFLLAIGLAGYLLNLVVRWQAACVLMTIVLAPVAAAFGIDPWVIGITALVVTNMWFLPYQSTIYQALYYGTDEQAFSHAQVRPIALAYGAACLLGLLASVPYWQALGLVPR